MENFELYFSVYADGDFRSTYSTEETNFFNGEDALLHSSMSNSLLRKSSRSDQNQLLELNKYYNVNANILLIKPFLEQLQSNSKLRVKILKKFQNKMLKDLNVSNNNIFKVCKCTVVIETNLSDSYVIDYAWGRRLWRDCHLEIERECAAAWLSTLGGGFSALGDYSSEFAVKALYTSLQQLKLAKICSDESGLARGLLFMALAFSQLGFDKRAGYFFERAQKHPSYDSRHKNMCLGVQVKLQYDKKARNKFSEKEKCLFYKKRDKLWNHFKTIVM